MFRFIKNNPIFILGLVFVVLKFRDKIMGGLQQKAPAIANVIDGNTSTNDSIV